MTQDEVYAMLITLTGINRTEWNDILSLPPPGQAVALQTYQDMNWQHDPDTVGRVITLIETLGAIGGAVGSVAGAVAVLRNL